jgi:hypothetical protein
MYRMIVRIAAVAGLALAAAGCGAPTATPEAPPVSPTAETAALQASAPPPSAPPAESPAATPTARRGLEATDPAAVALGAGRPTLVEFLAFW